MEKGGIVKSAQENPKKLNTRDFNPIRKKYEISTTIYLDKHRIYYGSNVYNVRVNWCGLLEKSMKEKGLKWFYRNSYRTSALFECLDCPQNWQGLDDSRKKAYQHAKNTGHKVRGEIGNSYHYN